MRLLLSFVLLLLAAPTRAQDPGNMTTERVRFERGESGAVIRGGTAGDSHRYLVNVRAGQHLSVSLENADAPGWAVLQVYAPGRPIQARYAAPRADGPRFDLLTWTGRLSRSGDYQIVVYAAESDADANYELTVSVK